MSQKEKIIEIIKRPNLMLGDIKTYIWLRSVVLTKYKSQKDGIGGGNFLMSLGCLSIMYFIARCHYVLKIGEQCKSHFKYIDERKALKELLSASPHIWDFNKWGLNKEEFDQLLDQVRDFFRNSLAHTGFPLKPVQSAEYPKIKNFGQVLKRLNEESGPPFVLKGKKISFIKSDLLLRDVLKAQKWLISQIESGAFKEGNLIVLGNKLLKEEEAEI